MTDTTPEEESAEISPDEMIPVLREMLSPILGLDLVDLDQHASSSIYDHGVVRAAIDDLENRIEADSEMSPLESFAMMVLCRSAGLFEVEKENRRAA